MKNIFWCTSLSIFLFLGCGAQKTAEVTPNVTNTVEKKADPVGEKQYDKYMLLMSDEQRSRFFKLNSDVQKERFLQAEGIYRKKELNDTLLPQMHIEEAKKLLGKPNDNEINMYEDEKEVRWTFVEFNKYRNMKYTLTFKNDKLNSWYLWLD